MFLSCVNLLSFCKELLSNPVRLARLAKRFPTCKFHHGVTIDNASQLGKYNVIFNNTSLMNSEIGDHTFIQKNSTINYAKIGKFTSIASGVTIGLGQHPTSYVSTHPAFYSKSQPIVKTFSNKDIFEPFQRTEIGHDVWIGQGTMVKDGVKIGTGAVIAAGAVVTKDIPDYAIAAGVPARVIRFRFDEATRKKLLDLKWWDLPEEWLKEHSSLFVEPVKLVEFIASMHNDRTNGTKS